MKEFDFDRHLDLELEKHLANQEMAELCSNCCGAPIIEESIDVCSDCLEPCKVIEMGEYMYEERANAECNKADAQIELKRELDDV